MINLNLVPTYSIQLLHLNEAIEITHIMKANNIKKYCYAFEIHTKTLHDVVKYGHSADNEWQRGVFGDRLYRQAWHIPGWHQQCSPLMWGHEMRDIIKHYTNADKNSISLTVWDMTNYPVQSTLYPNFELEQLEAHLIDNYQNAHKCMPLGNIRSEKSKKNKTVVADVTFNNLLELA
jgi:hypothetical protein